MESASELRKIVLEKEECDYLYKYNYTINLINEIIRERAKNGWLFLFLDKKEKVWTYEHHIFKYIDNKLYKDLKKYYKEKGFTISKSFFHRDIYIAW